MGFTDSTEKTLYTILRDYYKNIGKLEKIFLITFVIDMIGYSILLISFLISTGKIIANCANILLLFFPLISGIVTVNIYYTCILSKS